MVQIYNAIRIIIKQQIPIFANCKKLRMNNIVQLKSDYKSLLKLSKNLTNEEKRQIRTVFDMYQKLLQRGESKEYILGIEATQIMTTEFGLLYSSILPCMLHFLGYTYKLNSGQYEHFPSNEILITLKELEKTDTIDTTNLYQHPDNFLKLLLNLFTNFKSLLVLISEKLALLRKKELITDAEQQKVSMDAYYLYAPILHQLGLYHLNREMLDLAFSVLNPAEYDKIQHLLQITEQKRNEYIQQFIRPLEKEMNEHGLEYSIKSRTKSIHSIWKKMQAQNVGIERIYDLFAIRIILNSEKSKEKQDCWHAYSIVTNLYAPNTSRLRDWISIPKDSGYESLHTTVLGPDNKWVEVQIRTKRMDEIAEKGLAAHWKYKGGKSNKEYEGWLARFREILESPEKNVIDILSPKNFEVKSNEVFVFTPKGELRKMKTGATVLDFAFEVHTDVGCHCVLGRVNKKIVPIRHILENGDQIEIITNKNQKPTPDWLSIVVTNKAKAKIKRWLAEEEFKFTEAGKNILKRKCKNWKITLQEDKISQLIRHFNFENSLELYSGIAQEKIDFTEIKNVLTGKLQEKEINLSKEKKSVDNGKPINTELLEIEPKLDSLSYTFAKCCQPIPGDKIFGFITVDKGITIHKDSCPNVYYLLEKFPYRKIEAKWVNCISDAAFEVSIYINGHDQVGLLNKITELLSKTLHINIVSITIESKQKQFEGIFRIHVRDIEQLDLTLTKLKLIKGVSDVFRIEQTGS